MAATDFHGVSPKSTRFTTRLLPASEVLAALLMGEVMTVGEVAKRLGVSKATAYRLVERGELPAVRIVNSIRVTTAGLKHYLEDNSTGVPTVDPSALTSSVPSERVPSERRSQAPKAPRKPAERSNHPVEGEVAPAGGDGPAGPTGALKGQEGNGGER